MDDQAPVPISPSPQPTEVKPTIIKNPQKIKKIILSVIFILVILLVGAITTIKINEHLKETRVANDQKIIQLMFDFRSDAQAFYDKNFSYKDWQPDVNKSDQIQTLGSALVLRKPDYQSYIMYVYIQSDQKYFCIDTNQFANEVSQITTDQKKCQN